MNTPQRRCSVWWVPSVHLLGTGPGWDAARPPPAEIDNDQAQLAGVAGAFVL
jgi:hypothetical protein